MRAARALAVLLAVFGVALTIVLLLTDEGFTNLDCDIENVEEIRRDPTVALECKEPFALHPAVPAALAVAGAAAAVTLTVRLRRRP